MKPTILISVLFPLSVLADGGLPNQPYLYVEGQAEIVKPAETATLQFDLVARSSDQAKANQETQANAARILTMLNERKIEERDVIAQDVRSGPVYEDDDYHRNKIVGYSVTRAFEVKLRDVGLLAKLVDDLLAIGGVEFSRIDSGLNDAKQVNEEMWTKALMNARESAEKTLKTLGMKIDGVFAVSPVSVSETQSRMTNRGERVVVTGAMVAREPKLDAKHYRLAPITVYQSVHMIYLISTAR